MQAVVDFILEVDRLKAVERKNRPLGLARFENSAEHSWQIALLALAALPYAAEPVDADRVLRLLLVHDIGEIDTGDTMLYVEGGWDERKAAEQAAVQRITGLLPPAQAEALMALWLEFEAGTSPEARFAHALDRAMPVLLNLASNGQSWVENGIRYEQVLRRVGPPVAAGCPALWAHLKTQLDAAQAAGWYGQG